MFLPAAAFAQAPRASEVSEYRKDFPGLSRAQAEARLSTQQKGAGLVNQLKADLGPDYAGVWFDNDSGEFVVPVLPGADKGSVHAQLAGARLAHSYRTAPATHSWDELKAAHEEIDAELLPLIEQGLVQTSLDPRTNAVVVEVSSAAGAPVPAGVRGLTAGEAVKVEVRVVSAESFEVARDSCSNEARSCGYPLRGGVVISGGCTAGFKAVGKTYGNRFMLTAGHCAKEWPDFYAWDANDPGPGGYTEKKIGPTAANDYPGGDWAAINANGSEWDGSPWPSEIAAWEIDHQRLINYEAYSYLGQYVCRSGKTTGVSCGYVTALDQTVTFSDGQTTYHLTRWGPICSEGGDSGGPVYIDNTALGIHVGSSGSGCSKSGAYNEITEAADQLGVTVGTRIGGAPTAATGSATNLQPYQATLNGSVNPNSVETHYRFDWGKTTSYTNQNPYPDASAGHGSAAVGVNETIYNLDPATTYHYRLYAHSAAGDSAGSDATFTTPPAPPKATAEAASGVHVAEETGKATLNGKVNPGGASTDYRFEWGKVSEGFPSKVPVPDGDAGSAITYKSVAAQIGGLKGSTEYQYRIRAENEKGSVTSGVTKFTTPDWRPGVSVLGLGLAEPYVEDETGKIKLEGKVNPKGFATSYHFEWATQEEFEAEEFNNAAPPVEVGSCICEEIVEQTIEGIKGSTKYHFRLVAENAEGKASATSEETFTTPNWKPSSSYTEAIDIGADTATLVAWVYPHQFATTYRFEWATQAEFEAEEFGHVIEGESPITSKFQSEGTEVTAPLSGLTPWQTYHVRVTVESTEGTHTPEKAKEFQTSTGGFRAATGETYIPLTATGTPEDGPYTVEPLVFTISASAIVCPSPTLQATVESGANEGLDLLTLMPTTEETVECESPLINSTLDMNGCGFQLDPGYDKKFHRDGEFNVGPPGCGPIIIGNPYCKRSIPPQVGRDVEFFDEGAGAERRVKAEIADSSLRYNDEGSIWCGTGPRVGMGINATWWLEGSGEAYEGAGEEPVGLYTTSFVDSGPGAVTGDATEIEPDGAALGATVKSFEEQFEWYFEYGTDTEYGSVLEGGDVPAGEEDPFEGELTLEGLQPGTTYHYRVVASNDGGTTYGEDRTFTTADHHANQFAAPEYPATASGPNSVPVVFELTEHNYAVECESAELQGSLSSGEESLHLLPELESCEALGLGGEVTLQPNSCELAFDLLNTPAPYGGDLSIECAEEGDGLEFAHESCTLTVGPQTHEGTLDYENEGSGAAAKVHAEGEATGVAWTATGPGEGFICGLAGIPASGEDGALAIDADLEGLDEAEEAVGLFIDPASEVGIYMAGEGATAQVEALAYPAVARASSSTPVTFELGGYNAEVKCEEFDQVGTLSSGTPSLALFPVGGQECEASGVASSAVVQPNSCAFVFNVAESGPPYAGDLEVACAEEEDTIELVTNVGCTIEFGPQAPGGEPLSYETQGSGSSQEVHASGSVTEASWISEGFICSLGGLPSSGETATIAMDADIGGVYDG